MRLISLIISVALLASFSVSCSSSEQADEEAKTGKRWSVEKANQWYEEKGWLIGANYTPRTAINQLEMWQAETFDPEHRPRVEMGRRSGLQYHAGIPS